MYFFDLLGREQVAGPISTLFVHLLQLLTNRFDLYLCHVDRVTQSVVAVSGEAALVSGQVPEQLCLIILSLGLLLLPLLHLLLSLEDEVVKVADIISHRYVVLDFPRDFTL